LLIGAVLEHPIEIFMDPDNILVLGLALDLEVVHHDVLLVTQLTDEGRKGQPREEVLLYAGGEL
jgi:hypothetical protein